MAPDCYIGTSGWHYRHWRGRFYPEKLANLSKNLKAIYIYFNNDAEGFAVRNAVTLRTYLETQGNYRT